MVIGGVITGDLINYEGVEDPDAYLERLHFVLSKLKKFIPLEADVFRGDEFQIVPRQPQKAILCAILIRAGLIAASPGSESWDARVSIGLGSMVGGKNRGEAFVLSGRGLDAVDQLKMSVHTNNEDLWDRLEVPNEFAVAIIDSWTAIEANTYFTNRLAATKQEVTAELMNKTKATVSKALRRGHARLISLYAARASKWIREINSD